MGNQSTLEVPFPGGVRAHHRLTPIQAALLGRSLEPYDLFWLEDVTPAENQEALRLVRSRTTTPLATGELFNTIWDYQTLISEQLIDYVRSPVTHAGGITGVRRIMDYAAMYQIKSGMHGPTDVSPVGMSAAAPRESRCTTSGSRSTCSTTSGPTRCSDRPSSSPTARPSQEPVLGINFDDQLAEKYPYETAYLPTNRLQDGTVHDW